MSDDGVEIIDHGREKYKRQIKSLNGSYIKFGFFGGSNVGFAKIVHTHEMGGIRKTTRKQRWYLRSKGMEVGEEIIIPERSFIRTSFDENLELIQSWMEELFKKVEEGFSKQEAFRSIGKKCKGLVIKKLDSGDFVENDPFTREQKGYDKKPLEHTGALQEEIDFKVMVKE